MTKEILPLMLTKEILPDKMTKNKLSKGVNMAIVVGQSVRGENFWDRADELEAIWDAIDAGNHILLSAPRRVGKTSIMYKIKDAPKPNYFVVYVDTEAAYSEHEFWHKLFHQLIDQEFVATLQMQAKHFWEKLTRIRIKKVSTSGVEFDDGETLDYCSAFKKLLKDLQGDHKIVVMIDEFAQTVENIIKYEDQVHALHLLTAHSIKIRPLSPKEAEAFTSQLCLKNDIQIDTDTIKILLEKIEWLIPFYIQLTAQEIKKLKSPKVTCNDIDRAIDNALQHRNHFDHWLSKIKEAFERNDFLFAKEVLNTISEHHTIDSAAIHNIAVKHALDEERMRETMHALVYDGYINNNDNAKIYRFNSPMLRMWWYQNVAN